METMSSPDRARRLTVVALLFIIILCGAGALSAALSGYAWA